MNIMRYWFKLINISDSNILNAVYISMLLDLTRTPRQESWLNKVKNFLDRNGFSEIWYFLHLVKKEMFLPILKRRLIDIFIGELRGGGIRSVSINVDV